MQLKILIDKYPSIKKIVHRLLIPKNEARPRLWVKWFLNPFIHTRGKHSKIRRHARLDILPFNKFSLGSFSTIEDFCIINNGVGDVIIGNNTLIGIGNTIIGPISIGNNVIFAQNTVSSGINHEYRNVTIPILNQPILTDEITIEDDCWIGANVVIIAGVTIGKHVVLAAGAVVTKNIPSFSVAVGNPAKVIKQYNFIKQKWMRIEKSTSVAEHLSVKTKII